MKYSIIIPVYNRLEEIIECLASLDKIFFSKDMYEVIVIDDGSTDDTDYHLSNLEFNFDLYFQENKGQGAARNLGMEKASGDFFIFIDSDVTVPTDWLATIDRELGDADAFGGLDTCREDDPPLAKAINYSMTSLTGGLRGKAWKNILKQL